LENLTVTHLDETQAARQLNARWTPAEGTGSAAK